MELILISSAKLKVMLSAEDMEAYSLTCDTLDYDNTETRRAFWDILDTAKHRTGFDAAGARVYIQVYPAKSGGCEMFVTKLADRPDEKTGRSAGVTCRVRRDYPCGDGDKTEIYAFDSMEKLLDSCRLMYTRGFSGDSGAYSDEKRFFLVLSDCETHAGGALPSFSSLGEYGKPCGEYCDAYIAEHCRCICAHNAVEILSPLAV